MSGAVSSRARIRGEREEAAKRITNAFTDELLRLIKRRLGDRVRRRIDEEDVLQSALKSFFGRAPSFANRNAMFAYLAEIALNKAKNVVRHHGRKRRDIRQEVSAASAPDNLLEQGKPLGRARKSRRPYQPQLDMPPAEAVQHESFFSDAALEQMCYGQPADAADLFIDLYQILEDFDAREGDQLGAIVHHRLEGRSPAEIAKELGIAKRTVERKLKLIAELWGKSKAIRVQVEGASDQEGWPAVVLPRTTAADLLNRLGLPGRRLTRLVLGKPGRSLAPGDELYGLIAEGDLLLASPS